MKKLGILAVLWCLAVQVFAQNTDIALANEYFASGEMEKALSVYEKVADKAKEQELYEIHENYLATLVKLNKFADAQKYLKKMIKKFPEESIFNIDYGIFLANRGKKEESDKHFESYILQIKHDDAKIRLATRQLIFQHLYDLAERLYLEGRKNGKDMFVHELANLYASAGKWDSMIDEYLNFINQTGDEKLDYVQNFFRNKLKDDEQFAKLESFIFRYVQKYPDQIAYNEMLVWFYLQSKQFGKAFLQAKSIDRRKNLEGYQLYEIGTLCLKSQDYQNALKIYEYLIDKYKNRSIYPAARKMLVNAKEELAKNTFPIPRETLQSLANDYQQIINELGLRSYTADAARSLALLQAFYLNNKDTATVILQALISTAGMEKGFISQAKLDLGDIFLLKGESWESTLLYSQVEKAEKEKDLGHYAKLKNAKLSYYKGDFELAKDHLDILKLATSREIANDAIQLSLLIGDNMALDTSDAALRDFAATELLMFQGQYELALKKYDESLKKYPEHTLTDEIYWAKANILLKFGKFEDAVTVLEKILADYGDDILADDSNFTLGKIYQENLNNKEKAMEYFQTQLTKYQGSMYNVEARKRFRILRGDDVN
ncbi:MAG: hypothetical protein EAZ97_13685 [Bacteroidetes bacterium]|nr:MAG: hypothetical protein EAZ97_13685 [Bacteroidota bacterium]